MAKELKIPKSLSSKEDSIKWFKKITAYGVSNILYLRQFFDESAFVTVSFETHKLRLLSRKSGNASVLKIIDNLEDSFKMLEQNKLKSITMGIFEKIEEGFCQNAVEVVTFDFENSSLQLDGSNFKKEYTIALKNLFEILRAMKPFPKGSYYVLFKLQHLENFDPKKEGIRNFTPITESLFEGANFFIEDETESANFNAGSVSSNFHKVSINFKAEIANVDKSKLLNDSSDENIENENPHENSQGKGKRKIDTKAEPIKKRREI